MLIHSGLPESAARDEVRGFAVFARLLGPIIATYLLFDRAAAYLHVPGTLVYLAEGLLVVGIVASIRAPSLVRIAIRDDPLLCALIAFFLWGVVRTLPNIGRYGVTLTVHDAALWYYCLFAVLVVVASLVSPDLPTRLAGQLLRFAPWLLAWLPIAVILGIKPSNSIRVPFSTVSVFSHKDGNAAVAAFLALAALCLLPSSRLTVRTRRFWALVAVATIAVAGTQNRGGFVAAAAAAIIGLFLYRPIARLAAIGIAIVAVAGVVVGLALPNNSRHSTRSVSASQLIVNMESLAGLNKSHSLQGTEQARQRQWAYVVQQERQVGRIVYGWGPGPNLGFGQVTGTGDETLRVPHNSHVDVLARLGLIGLGLWILLWVAWTWRVLSARQRLAVRGRRSSSRILDVCFVTAVAIQLNAFFDPSLEGGQVAVLLWTIFGVGAVLSNPRWTNRFV